MVGIANQAARGVPVLGQQSQEATGDLPVAPGDENVHGPRLEEQPSSGARTRSEAATGHRGERLLEPKQ